MKLEQFDSRYFFEKDFFGNDDFQIMFVYQPRFNTWELKESKGTDYVN